MDKEHPNPPQRLSLYLMNTVVYDSANSVFELTADFHTPSWFKFGDFEFQPVFLYLVICNSQFFGIVMLGPITSGAFEVPGANRKSTT